MSCWIGEAGSTKTDWVNAQGEIIRQPGFNIEIEGEAVAYEHFQVTRQKLLEAGWGLPETIYYYGPALHSAFNREKLRALLAQTFPEVREIQVEHDLLAAARASWGFEPGIVAILGTGSNCAWWNGHAFERQAGGHGYLLGDEGSGADLGKHLLSALLHGELPSDLATAFAAQFPTSPLALRQAVYRAVRPSALLASFAPFLSAHLSHPWVKALVLDRFRSFIRRTWGRWPDKLPIRYVGSVALYFAPFLEQATQELGGKWDGVIPQVALSLLAYHQRR